MCSTVLVLNKCVKQHIQELLSSHHVASYHIHNFLFLFFSLRVFIINDSAYFSHAFYVLPIAIFCFFIFLRSLTEDKLKLNLCVNIWKRNRYMVLVHEFCLSFKRRRHKFGIMTFWFMYFDVFFCRYFVWVFFINFLEDLNEETELFLMC